MTALFVKEEMDSDMANLVFGESYEERLTWQCRSNTIVRPPEVTVQVQIILLKLGLYLAKVSDIRKLEKSLFGYNCFLA